MTNDTMVLLFGLLSVITGIVLFISIVQKVPKPLRVPFVWLGVCILCALTSDVIYFAIDLFGWFLFFYNLKVPFMLFASVATFILVLRFYHQDKILTRRFKICLTIFPILISLCSLTSEYHYLFRYRQAIIADKPLRLVGQIRGFGFWLYVGYCYILLIGCLFVALRQHRKLPKGYRASSLIMIISLFVTGAASILNAVFPAIPFDCTLVAMGVGYVFIYLALLTSAKTDLLVVARDEIFNYLEELVFILSLDRQVLDANQSARRWMTSLDLTVNFPVPFSKIMSALHDKGVAIRENDSSEDGIDIYFSHNEYDVMYNLKERFVLDVDERPIGFYITLFDVTRYKTIIDRLEIMAEVDPLTGLPNRRAYEALKTHYQKSAPPLSVIIGDVNNLKKVNDELGHQQGDQLLQVVSRQLRRSCPENGTVLRIGGDEFVMFLPNTTTEDARRVMVSIDQSLRNKTAYPFSPSIALGLSTKLTPGEDIEAVIRHADIDMYNNKNDRRKR